jgi:hypothetical protein
MILIVVIDSLSLQVAAMPQPGRQAAAPGQTGFTPG